MTGYGTFATGSLTNGVNATINIAGGPAHVQRPGRQCRRWHRPRQFHFRRLHWWCCQQRHLPRGRRLDHFAAGFTNNGSYISDPSTNIFTDLSITPTGALQGGAGDEYIVSGNYSDASVNTANWNNAGGLARA